jgi:hypothetical protein
MVLGSTSRGRISHRETEEWKFGEACKFGEECKFGGGDDGGEDDGGEDNEEEDIAWEGSE